MLTIATTFGAGLVAGVLMSVQLAVLPAYFSLPRQRAVEVHQLLNRHFDPVMPMINTATILAAIALLFLRDSAAARVPVGIGVLMALAVVGISQFGNVPINRHLAGVEAETVVPEEADRMLRRWARFHLWRTAAAFVALGAFATAATAVA